MLLDDQLGRSGAGTEPVQPPAQELVECLFADPDGWVRPDLVDHQVIRHLGGGDHLHPVSDTVGERIAGAELAGSFVHVDGPDRGLGSTKRQSHRDGSVAAAHIGQHGPVDGRSLAQQDPGTGVDTIPREDALVGREGDETTFWQRQFQLDR